MYHLERCNALHPLMRKPADIVIFALQSIELEHNNALNAMSQGDMASVRVV